VQKLPLIGGSYSARSVISNCQRCINLFPERNPKDSPTPLTHYQRPGLIALSTPPVPGAGRCLYQASNGNGYAVVGRNIYYISQADFSFNFVGTVSGVGSTPVSMCDNGFEMMVVDNSPFGWRFRIADNLGFTQITDLSFVGATRVDFIDTFLIWNQPGTVFFQSSLSNQVEPMDPLYFAGKAAWPDPLQSIIVNKHQILLPGRLKGEQWYDAGNPAFPFAMLPGAYVEHGTVAPYSVVASDICVYWLGQDLQGIGEVWRLRGYQCQKISNPALEFQIRKMYDQGTISDCVAYTYQQDGHRFVVFNFPTGDQSWVWDETVDDPMMGWHQRCWIDSQGTLHRERPMGYASLYGKQVALDWQTGTLYKLDLNTYSDQLTVGGAPGPCFYARSFPHLMAGFNSQGQQVLAEGRMVQHDRFLLDIDCGNVPQQASPPVEPLVTLKWSDDRGHSWNEGLLQTIGELGQYGTRPEWGGLGQAMDRIYDVSWSLNGPATLNGAWVEGRVLAR
jgi:hypothetical protein